MDLVLSVLQEHAEILFSERVVKVWNSLPPSIVNFSSSATFRNSLKIISFRIYTNITAFSVAHMSQYVLFVILRSHCIIQIQIYRTKKIKSVNIRQSYKQERDCFVHFSRLLAVCWPSAQVHETITFLLVTLPNIYRF